ncbi:hypothetical protein [Sphingomonas sp. GC_Shp_4]|uniref:hypothetical protein n=2 Tax=Sphingomonas TaxID=13687 RepID=UPI00226B29C5|nr:hypothetical protein [Sphingomonas sp. GC_Shp_4]
MLLAMMLAVGAGHPFSCTVTHVHDCDGPLWCSTGIKVRVAGVRASDFTSAEPCRRTDGRRVNYTCDDWAAARSQQIVERLCSTGR